MTDALKQTHEQAALDLLTRTLPHLKLAKGEATIAGDKERKARLVAAIAQINLAIANLMAEGEALELGGPMVRAGGNVTVLGSMTGGDKIETHINNIVRREPE